MEAVTQTRTNGREPRDGAARGRNNIERLKKLAEGKSSFLAQAHDYPDPDTLASAFALTWLMKELTGIDAQVGYGGIVGRAENRAMVRAIGIKIKKTLPADFAKYDLVALLDTQPECGNHSVPHECCVDIVVDHHFPRERSGPQPAYYDVGGEFGTTSSKVTELVRASGRTPPPDVATALFYGVKSDTMNLARVTTPTDIAAYLYLFPMIDRALLTEIEHPQLPITYFRILNKALERSRVYQNMVVADLGAVYTPDLCAELADRLLQIEGVKHALATGWYEDSLFMSLRTRSQRKNAGKILHGIVSASGLGSAGGHGPMAGARLDLSAKGARARADVRRRIITQILEAFGEDPRRYHKLVSEAAERRED
ncbi:MAG: bifunctional oligoribonuclease/PAP phosphatase NrnA [Deltaproteobacteria bacterium]|nr:bifunctional oligoribonuclease/PAP phosphatase NrnA [Deltaproteobacteria bacterium]